MCKKDNYTSAVEFIKDLAGASETLYFKTVDEIYDARNDYYEKWKFLGSALEDRILNFREARTIITDLLHLVDSEGCITDEGAEVLATQIMNASNFYEKQIASVMRRLHAKEQSEEDARVENARATKNKDEFCLRVAIYLNALRKCCEKCLRPNECALSKKVITQQEQ